MYGLGLHRGVTVLYQEFLGSSSSFKKEFKTDKYSNAYEMV